MLNALLMGISAEQIAELLCIRSDTVRGQIKRMLAKTGCSRQQELLQFAAKALPNLPLINDSTPP